MVDNLLSIKQKLGTKVKSDASMSAYTTLGIGGPASLLLIVKNEAVLLPAVKIAEKEKVPFIIIGEGSDLLVSDAGFKGIVIVNRIIGIKRNAKLVRVAAGTNLQKFINFLIDNGFMGMEKMSGIPGTVGGAVYGNAGAYGQTISDHIVRVRGYHNGKVSWFNKNKSKLEYRESIFKNKKILILEAEFSFDNASKEILKKESLNIIQMRSAKYPPNLKCPGSFFKNIIASDLSPSVLKKIPTNKIVFGKIPAGYLMEDVGAKGKAKGNIKIADYHGNLIFNLGGGNASDFLSLANFYASKVKKKFGIQLEPEVQLVGFDHEQK